MSDIIYLNDNLIIDLRTRQITKDGRRVPLSSGYWPVLKALADAGGAPVPHVELAALCTSDLNKCRFYIRKALGDAYIETIYGEGTVLRIPPQPQAQSEDTPPQTEPVPPCVLTNTVVPYIDESQILHRSKELHRLKNLLARGKQAIMIRGMGGLGKTTLARWIYAQLGAQYDSIGWVEYRSNLKHSILSCFTQDDSTDSELTRWSKIRFFLQNSRAKKLLIIDNADRDARLEQDPLSDPDLAAISSWPNLTVILTSRLSYLPGYIDFPLQPISPSDCKDLFYFYYDYNEYNRLSDTRKHQDAVRELVELAGYNTLVVEVLAKSAKYRHNLPEYLAEIRHIGFRFPELTIHTEHRNAYANAAGQLRKLFDLQSRTETERQILWDFSSLPHTELTFDEIRHLLGYEVNQLDPLINEGWLTYRDGVSMHPLVQETIRFEHERPPRLEKLFALLSAGTLFSGDAFLFDPLRLLELASHGIQDLSPSPSRDAVKAYRNLGRWYLQRGQVAQAEDLLRHAEAMQSHRLSNTFPLRPHREYEFSLLAKCRKDLGYLLSYTNGRRAEATDFLEQALKLWDLPILQENEAHLPQYAETCDYLGYLFSDIPSRHAQAEQLLGKALDVWHQLEKKQPGAWQHKIAWTMDNLGYLLSQMPTRRNAAEGYLRSALSLRQKLNHTSEIAWTLNNLAVFLHGDPLRWDEAEQLYRKALDIRRRQNENTSNCVAADIAILCGNLGILLTQKHTDEAYDFLLEALETNHLLESRQHFVYQAEEAVACFNLAGHVLTTAKKYQDLDYARQLYTTALEIYQQLDQSDCYQTEIADICWNLGILNDTVHVLDDTGHADNSAGHDYYQRAAALWKKSGQPAVPIKLTDRVTAPNTPLCTDLLLFHVQSGSRKNAVLLNPHISPHLMP